MARKRTKQLSDFDRDNLVGRSKSLISDINERLTGLKPNSDDYKSLSAFHTSTKQLIMDLTGDPNYFNHAGSGLHGLGSSRERP